MEETIEKQGDLILVRGLPGSGKSTFSNVILHANVYYKTFS